MTAYDWDTECMMTEQPPKAILGKISPQPVAEKLTKIDMKGVDFAQSNFSLIHRAAQYPGADNLNSRNGHGNAATLD